MTQSRPVATLLALLAAALALAVVPRTWCAQGADAWYHGSPASSRALGTRVARDLAELDAKHFSTGSRRFDGEWRFGSALMAALGFGQTAVEHAELRPWALERMDRALDAALVPEARAFDREAWSEDALDSLGGARGHAAYLGYLDLALSLRRFAEPGSRFDALNERVTDALAHRLASAVVVETYPGERYPVDNAAGVAALALYDRARGQPRRALVSDWLAVARERLIDRRTGLLFQAVGEDGSAADRPRASGTALAAYFLSFADAELSRELYRALGRGDVLGFGVVREYPPGASRGAGDIDSGPLVFGWSISAMGFALSGARGHHDPDGFRALYRGFHLFGAPYARGDERGFASGGALGNAILFAMLTALPAERWSRP